MGGAGGVVERLSKKEKRERQTHGLDNNVVTMGWGGGRKGIKGINTNGKN